MEHHGVLPLVLIVLFSAVLIVPLFQRAGLGAVLGYLVTGSILGPSGLGFFHDIPSILRLAELGVVLLLFVIGLELKPSRLWAMRNSIFGLGTLQMAVTTALLSFGAWQLGLSWSQALIVGAGISLSSTALSLQILSERNQVNTTFGRSAFAVLLFQDLAAIPLITLVPLLSPANASAFDWHKAILPVLVIVGLVVVGRYALRPWFRFAASARVREVFTSAALLVVLGAAFLMEHFGLSMALGTFLAGILLSDSEYRHELETDLEPFKGLLLGLFFMAVGMSVDYAVLLSQPATIFGVTLAWMAVKFLCIFILGRAFGQSSASSGALAQVLCMGGEFAFVVFGAAATMGVIAPEVTRVLILSVALSMVLTPIFYFLRDKLLVPLRKDTRKFDTLPSGQPRVILAGFGRVGQIVGRILRVYEIPYVALELDPAQVDLVRKFGTEIYYGDASRSDLLDMAGAEKAELFVLAVDDVDSSLRVARMVKEKYPHLKILARARNRTHAFELFALGIDDVFRETLGTSFELAESTLNVLGFEAGRAADIIRTFRLHDEQALADQRKHYGDEKSMIRVAKQSVQQLGELLRRDLPNKEK